MSGPSEKQLLLAKFSAWLTPENVQELLDSDPKAAKLLAELAGELNPDIAQALEQMGLEKSLSRDPKGFVSPSGEVHQIDPRITETHHEWVSNHTYHHHPELHATGPEHEPNKYADDSYMNAIRAGWMSFGIGADYGPGNGHNFQAHEDHLSNPNAPALRQIRDIAKQHWGESFDAMIQTKDGLKRGRYDTEHFVRHGTLRPFAEEPVEKSEGNQAKRLGITASALHDAWADDASTPENRDGLHEHMMHSRFADIRRQMANKLAQQVPTKEINGKRHFLLHRRHAPIEGDVVTHEKPTSYSSIPKEKMNEVLSGGDIHGAWIPESKISYVYEHALDHYPKKLQPEWGSGFEGEVIVGPGKYPVHEKFFHTEAMARNGYGPISGHSKDAWDLHYALTSVDPYGQNKSKFDAIKAKYGYLKKSDPEILEEIPFDEAVRRHKEQWLQGKHKEWGDTEADHYFPFSDRHNGQPFVRVRIPTKDIESMACNIERIDRYKEIYARKGSMGPAWVTAGMTHADGSISRDPDRVPFSALDGNHRVKAAQELGHETIEAIMPKAYWEAHVAGKILRKSDTATMERYSELAHQQSCLLYPVTIRGESKLYKDLDFHISLKVFNPDVSVDEILGRIGDREFDVPDPKAMAFFPERFTSRQGNEYCFLTAGAIPKSMLDAYALLDGIGIQYPEYKAHITILEDLMEQLESGEVAVDQLDIQIGPLELRSKSKLVRRWGPLGLEKSKDPYSFHYSVGHDDELEQEVHQVTVHHPEHGEVGSFSFWNDGMGGIEAMNASVDERHRRKGIASRAYQMAADRSGKRVMPSFEMTPDAEAFWANKPRFGIQPKTKIEKAESSKHELLEKSPFGPKESKLLREWQRPTTEEEEEDGIPDKSHIRQKLHDKFMRPEHKADRQVMQGGLKVDKIPMKMIDGKEHFLMHRGSYNSHYYTDHEQHVEYHEPVSMSASLMAASSFARHEDEYNHGGELHGLHSVWVPKDAVSVYLPYAHRVGHKEEKYNLHDAEKEAFVAPGKYPKATKEELRVHVRGSAERSWIPVTNKKLKKSEPLAKNKILKIPLANGLETKVHRNPTEEQAHTIHSRSKDQTTRYFAHPDGDLYMWDAFDLSHGDVMEHLGVEHTGDNYAGAGTITSHQEAREVARRFREAAVKKSEEELQKMPFIHEHNIHVAQNLGPYVHGKHQRVIKMNGHQVHYHYDDDGGDHYFSIHRDNDPKKEPIAVLHVSSNHYEPDFDFENEHVAQHAATLPKYQHKGLGSAIFQAAVKELGSMYASNAMSPASHATWKRMKDNPNIKIKLGRGESDPHYAEWVKPTKKQKLRKHLELLKRALDERLEKGKPKRFDPERHDFKALKSEHVALSRPDWLGRKEYRKYQVRSNRPDQNGLFEVTAHYKGKEIGNALFLHRGDHISGLTEKETERHGLDRGTRVDEEHRRSGVATAMYDHAERAAGVPARPSSEMTADAKAFWADRLKKSEPSGDPGRLEKAIHPDHWNQAIAQAYNPSYEQHVDYSHYLKTDRLPDHIRQHLDSPEIHQPEVTVTQPRPGEQRDYRHGVSSKLVLQNVPNPQGGSDTVSIKPLHRTPERGTEHYAGHPTGGWSTLATRNLYRAAGMGHLVESVHAHEHQGVPVAVSLHQPNAVTVESARHPHLEPDFAVRSNIQGFKPKIDHLQVHQKATLDYLAGNVDRNGRNMMVSLTPNKQGHNDLLSIDHDKSFHYHQAPKGARSPAAPGETLIDKPSNYLHHPKGIRYARELALQHNPGEENGTTHRLHAWWGQHRNQIVESFQQDLAHIKTPALKQHIHENFMARVSSLDRWHKNFDKNPNLFSRRSDHGVVNREVIPRPVWPTLPKPAAGLQPNAETDKMHHMVMGNAKPDTTEKA